MAGRDGGATRLTDGLATAPSPFFFQGNILPIFEGGVDAIGEIRFVTVAVPEVENLVLDDHRGVVVKTSRPKATLLSESRTT